MYRSLSNSIQSAAHPNSIPRKFSSGIQSALPESLHHFHATNRNRDGISWRNMREELDKLESSIPDPEPGN